MAENKEIIIEFDQEKFNLDISRLQEKDLSYIEAIVQWCEENEIELDIIASVFKKMPENKKKLEEEAKKRFLLKD